MKNKHRTAVVDHMPNDIVTCILLILSMACEVAILAFFIYAIGITISGVHNEVYNGSFESIIIWDKFGGLVSLFLVIAAAIALLIVCLVSDARVLGSMSTPMPGNYEE